MALKEKRFEEAQQLFTDGIKSAKEFGRVDELARGQLGLASVYLETRTDLNTALVLINESTDSFQQQGMQYEIQNSQDIRERIIRAQS